jgi:hypothetical protein
MTEAKWRCPTTKGLTTKALQILLILELKAGASRIAKLSHREIAGLTGYSLRCVERSLRSLRMREWISQIEHRVIQLPNPIPIQNYVQVYEGVVHHPQWKDWQKHLLLFVMSQFRGQEQGFGVPTYSLNLYGRKGQSVEKCCRIPGSAKERRVRIREFIKQLENQQIIRIVEDATSNRPAICTVNRNTLENIRPDYERYQIATLRTAVPKQGPHRHAKRSNTVTRNVAHRHASRSNTVIRNVATPSHETYVKDPKDSEDSKKIPESPRSAFGGRGAISSQSRDEASGDDSESGHGKSDSHDDDVAVGDDLTSLMGSKRHRELTREIECRCSGFHLGQSRADRDSLVGKWTALLEELPDDLEPDDVVDAIISDQFAGLNSKSWGLLLSDKFITRFCIEIRKNYEERKRPTLSTKHCFDSAREALGSRDVATRKYAVESLTTFSDDKRVPLIIAGLLVGKQADPDATVRRIAVQKLDFLAAMGQIPDEVIPAIRLILPKVLKDKDATVRESAGYLRESFGVE